MREDWLRERQPPDIPVVNRQAGSAIIFAIIALALLLAVGFFYLTGDRDDDRPADTVTQAAGSLDDAARSVGDAAKNAAHSLRKDK